MYPESQDKGYYWLRALQGTPRDYAFVFELGRLCRFTVPKGEETYSQPSAAIDHIWTWVVLHSPKIPEYVAIWGLRWLKIAGLRSG